jgi:hypothetical protein
MDVDDTFALPALQSWTETLPACPLLIVGTVDWQMPYVTAYPPTRGAAALPTPSVAFTVNVLLPTDEVSIELPLSTGPAHIATPEPPSVQPYDAATLAFRMYVPPLGTLSVMLGAFLSTSSPVYGPAVTQFPATSHTAWLGVEAAFVSVPAGTLVESPKDASFPLASPDVASPALQVMVTSDGLQPVGGDEQDSVGAVESSLTVTLDDEVRPAPLVAVQVRVIPAVSPLTVDEAHPDEEEMPDSGSATVQVTVTGPTYQPFAPCVPLTLEVITGGVESALAGV